MSTSEDRKGVADANIWMVLLGILVIFTGVILYARHLNIERQEGAENSVIAQYTNYAYGVSFRYPPDFLPARGYSYERYEGDGGFFGISAGGESSLTLDEVVKSQTEHNLKPYGTNPDVQALSVDGEQARIILPSEDQSPSMDDQAALVVRYPKPVTISSEEYAYFILWADKSNIHYIASSFKFIRE